MRHGKLIDTEKLIGQKNREDEQGEAPERFTMRESPYTILIPSLKRWAGG